MDKKLTLKMKELTKVARQKGKVLSVSEAFKMHPISEEAHKGKIEYWQK
jgi:hypothetical protein